MSKEKRHKKGYNEDLIERKKNRKTFRNHIQEKHLHNVLRSRTIDPDALEDVLEQDDGY